MKRIDSEFMENLAKARKLLPKIEKMLAYTGDEDLPGDLDNITSQSQIETFNHWSTKLEDKVLELLTLVENMKVCGTIQENFYEHENESLPNEGFQGYTS